MSQDDATRRLAKPKQVSDEQEATLPARAAPLDETFRAQHVVPAKHDADTLPFSGSVKLPVGATIGRYVVLGPLGRGGMGMVYAAYDPVLDRKIAVKLLHRVVDDDGTEGRSRMQREAQALARLSHPNVITVHDVSEHEGSMYIAMEMVAGGTLSDWQKRKSWREIVDTYAAAAHGLAAAHAAGLVHRDFKPDNVLVGDDGRVRVTDFGLAAFASSAVETQPMQSPGSALSEKLTAAGTVMGTPNYMAPEQIDGEAVDARTDQFSWCLALWEALFGEQPWPRGNLSIRAAAMRVDLPKPPAASNVPRAVSRILARGLSPDPSGRWPSLAKLVGQLERATSRRNVVFAGAAVAGIATIAIVFAVGRRSGATEPSCDASTSPIDGVWTSVVQGRVRARFANTNAGFAQDAVGSVDRAITRWVERWRGIALESCRATRDAGTQSEAILDLRSACLVRRRDELKIVIAALEVADIGLVERAPTLALPDLETCNDAAVLAGAVAPPADPASQQARTRVETELATIEAELVHGLAIERAKQLEDITKQLVERATAVKWAPLVARTRTVHAGVLREVGNGKQARTVLMAAAASASAANDLDQLVSIYSDLIDVETRLTSDYAVGDGWASLADGTLARLGPRVDKQLRIHRRRARNALRAGRLEDARAANLAALELAKPLGPIAELEVLSDLGIALGELGELDTAIQHLERAHTLARAEVGAKHPKLGTIEHDLGTITYRRAKYPDAEKRFRAALAIREANSDELATAGTMQGLGIAILQQGRIAEAQPLFERALEIQVKRLGPEHPDVANALNDVGGAYHQAGQFERELAVNERALAIRERALGPDHPDVGQSLVNVAIASKALERWAVVIPNYRRAIAIFEKSYGISHLTTAITRLNFAEALRVQGRLDAATGEYEAARIVFAKQLGEDHSILSHIWNGVGQLELARNDLAAAVPLLERAVAMRAKDPGDATALAESRFALARALGKQHPRGVPLAKQAADAYRAAGASFAKQAVAIDKWLR